MSGPTEPDLLSHCVEWCEQTDGTHDDTCPDHPMEPMTKGEWVRQISDAVGAAIDDYVFMLGEGYGHEDAKDVAVAQADEGSVCYAGIGSCGRGWCQHS